MTQINEIYRCNICGNIVKMVHNGIGTLVCCSQNMELLKENTTDAALEKHVPVIEKNGSIVQVTVGEVAHPMEDKHYIEWIELTADDKQYFKFLKPGDEPMAEFCINNAKELSAKEYCNLHGLWKK